MENKNLQELTLKIFNILKSRPTDSRKASKPLYNERLDNLNSEYGRKPEGEAPLLPASDKPGPQHEFAPSEELGGEVDKEAEQFYTLMSRYNVRFEVPDNRQLLEILAIIANAKIPLKHIQANESLKTIKVVDRDDFLAKFNNDTNELDLSEKLFDEGWRSQHPFHRIRSVPAIYELLVHEIGHSVEKNLHETDKPVIDPHWHEVAGWAYPKENEQELEQKGYVPALQTFLAVPIEKMTTLEDPIKDREGIAERIKDKNPYQLPEKVLKISWYGCVGPREDFAESYVNFVLNGKKMRKREPERYEYMRNYIFDGQEYDDLVLPKSAVWQEIMSRIQKSITICQIHQFNKAFEEMTKSKYINKSSDFDDHIKRNWRILRRNGFRPIVVKSYGGRSWLEVTIGGEKITVDTWGKFIGKSTKNRPYPILKSRKAPYGHKGYTRVRRGKPEIIQQKGVPQEVARGVSIQDVRQAQAGNVDAFGKLWHNLFVKLAWQNMNRYEYLSPQDKEEIENDIKWKIWRKLPDWSPDKSSKLTTYFKMVIYTVTKKYIRDKGEVLGGRATELLWDIYEAQREIKEKTGKDATVEQIAKYVQADKQEVVNILNASNVFSLEDKVVGTEDISFRDMQSDPTIEAETRDTYNDWQFFLKTLLKNGIIDKDDAEFLHLYYWEGRQRNKELIEAGITRPDNYVNRLLPRVKPYLQQYYGKKKEGVNQ